MKNLVLRPNTAFLFSLPKIEKLQNSNKFKLIFKLNVEDLISPKEDTFEIGYIYFTQSKAEKIKKIYKKY